MPLFRRALTALFISGLDRGCRGCSGRDCFFSFSEAGGVLVPGLYLSPVRYYRCDHPVTAGGGGGGGVALPPSVGGGVTQGGDGIRPRLGKAFSHVVIAGEGARDRGGGRDGSSGVCGGGERGRGRERGGRGTRLGKLKWGFWCIGPILVTPVHPKVGIQLAYVG